MKKTLALLFTLALAASAFAQNAPETNNGNGNANTHKFMERGYARPGGGGSQNLSNHGGPVIVAPKVAFIFWGFGAGNSYTAAIQDFRNNGIYSHSRMLSQYSNAGASAPTNLGGNGNDKFDSSTPPANVTDATVQSEVKKYFHGSYDTSTVYEVVLPIGSYSS